MRWPVCGVVKKWCGVGVYSGDDIGVLGSSGKVRLDFFDHGVVAVVGVVLFMDVQGMYGYENVVEELDGNPVSTLAVFASVLYLQGVVVREQYGAF